MVVQSLADSASGGHVSGRQDHVGAVKKPFHPLPNLIPHHPQPWLPTPVCDKIVRVTDLAK